MDDVGALSATIRAARREAGITQADLAELAGTSERTVRSLESGTGNPSLRAVMSIARVLGLRLELH